MSSGSVVEINPSGSAGAPASMPREEFRAAIETELLDYFNNRGGGIRLAEFEARYIASGILARLSHRQMASEGKS